MVLQGRRIFLDRRLSAIIGYGLCFLIVFPPLAFGAVYSWAFSILELVCFSLLMVWLIATRYKTRDPHPRTGRIQRSLAVPFAVFIGLVLFQTIPMPPALLRIISPQTHAIYCETLDGYGTSHRSQESGFGSQNMARPRLGFDGPEAWEIKDLEDKKEIEESVLNQSQRKGFFHDWRSLSVYRHATKVELLKILAYASTFFLILSWVDDRSKLLRLLFLLVITGLLVSTIGIFQRFLGVEKIYGLWKPMFGAGQTSFGPYVNPNHFAGYIALIIPIAVCLLIRHLDRMGRGRTGRLKVYLQRLRERDILVALFLLLTLYVMVSGLFLSLSRGGVFAFAGSMIFLMIALLVQEGRRWMLGLALLVVFFTVLFVSWLGFVPFEARIKTIGYILQDATVRYRLEVWKNGWGMLMDFPLFGTGLGTFAHIYPKIQNSSGSGHTPISRE